MVGSSAIRQTRYDTLTFSPEKTKAYPYHLFIVSLESGEEAVCPSRRPCRGGQPEKPGEQVSQGARPAVLPPPPPSFYELEPEPPWNSGERATLRPATPSSHGVAAAAGGAVQVHWCARAASHGVMVPGIIGAQLLYLLPAESSCNVVLFRAYGHGAHLNTNKKI